MLCLKDGGSCKIPFGVFCVMTFHSVIFLLLTKYCEGQLQLTGPTEPIVAIVGDDITLPCNLDPAVNVADMTVEWTRSDLTPRFVHVLRDGVELERKKHAAYKGRTSMSMNKLKLGDASLKLSKVKLSDGGTYICFIPALNGQASVELIVGKVASLVISLMRNKNDQDSRKVALQCESAGWYPEPEVIWLHDEGIILTDGPRETFRGPDGLYTVSSRVTVESKHSNRFICRVQQKNINQSRETHIQVEGDVFNASCGTAAHITIRCLVLVAAVLLIPAIFFLVSKWSQKQNWLSKCQGNNIQATDTEIHPFVEDLRETLQAKEENILINNSEEEKEKLSKQLNELQEEKLYLVNIVNLLMIQKSQTEQTNTKITTEKLNEKDPDRTKKELERNQHEMETFLKSLIYGVKIMSERKKIVDSLMEKTSIQLEEIGM